MQSFATIIKRARKAHGAHGWTLDFVASRTRSHKGYISGMESRAVNPPSSKLVIRLAKLYGLDEKDLLLRAELEKAPKEIRAELKRRAHRKGRNAARHARHLRARARERLKKAWQLVEEALDLAWGLPR